MKKLLLMLLIATYSAYAAETTHITEEHIKDTPFISMTLYESTYHKPIGYCTIIPKSDHVELGYLRIVAGNRRQGFGSLLLNHARSKAKDLNLPMLVDVEPIEGNTLAQSIAFYKHNGGQLMSQTSNNAIFKFIN
jgi:GNAT superfamily N-acetyltransferase